MSATGCASRVFIPATPQTGLHMWQEDACRHKLTSFFRLKERRFFVSSSLEASEDLRLSTGRKKRTAHFKKKIENQTTYSSLLEALEVSRKFSIFSASPGGTSFPNGEYLDLVLSEDILVKELRNSSSAETQVLFFLKFFQKNSDYYSHVCSRGTPFIVLLAYLRMRIILCSYYDVITCLDRIHDLFSAYCCVKNDD